MELVSWLLLVVVSAGMLFVTSWVFWIFLSSAFTDISRSLRGKQGEPEDGLPGGVVEGI